MDLTLASLSIFSNIEVASALVESINVGGAFAVKITIVPARIAVSCLIDIGVTVASIIVPPYAMDLATVTTASAK
jgi:hypothetical protein